MKKIMMMTLAILCATWLTGCNMNSGSTNPKITIDQAKEIALKQANVKQDDVVKMDVEDTTIDEVLAYEIDFKTDGKEYEYHIDQETGDILVTKVKERTIDDQMRAITKEEAELLAFTHANTSKDQVTSLHTETDTDDGVKLYVVSFVKDNQEYEYEIGKDNGQLIKYEVENLSYKKKTTQKFTISLEKASQLALDKVPGATKEDLTIKADLDDGKAIYEGEIQYKDTEYEFEIDAETGAFLQWEQEALKLTNNPTLSKKQASIIALDKVPGATQANLSISLDEEDGMAIYEGDIHYQGYEYEFEIDATTGAVISWEKDIDD